MKKVIYAIRYAENGEIFSSNRVFDVESIGAGRVKLRRDINHPDDNYPDKFIYEWEEEWEEIERQDNLKKAEKPFGGYSIIE